MLPHVAVDWCLATASGGGFEPERRTLRDVAPPVEPAETSAADPVRRDGRWQRRARQGVFVSLALAALSLVGLTVWGGGLGAVAHALARLPSYAIAIVVVGVAAEWVTTGAGAAAPGPPARQAGPAHRQPGRDDPESQPAALGAA